MAQIQLICCYGGIKAGLHADILLLTEVLTAAGHVVTFTRGAPVGPAVLTPPKQPGAQCYDLNIFVQACGPQQFLDQYLAEARYNALLPNLPQYPTTYAACLPQIDAVFCKERQCEQVFKRLCGGKAIYTSFTSFDHYRPGYQPRLDLFHGPGSSIWRGTQAIMELWQDKGFVMPTLQIYFSPVLVAEHVVNLFECDNVVKHMGQWERNSFVQIQNQYRFHLCPSLYEGFGHHIHEAKSIGAIPITTDAAPLNEFVRPEFGILVSPVCHTAHHLIQLHEISPVMLEAVIRNEVEPLMRNKERMEEMSALAREDYLHNDRQFRQRFPEIVDELLKS